MMNLIDRDIAYTHRPSDFTQDVYVEDCRVASAKSYHSADEAADEVQYRALLSDDLPGIENEPSEPPVYPQPGGRAERCACGAPAAWEVPFSTAPRYEYFCAAHLPEEYMPTPIAWPAHICTNCEGKHNVQQCPEVRAALFAPLDDYATCSSCGDLHSCNSADPLPFVCPACREWTSPAIAPYDTDELARLWATSRTLLTAKLTRLTRPQLHAQAIAFAAWLDERTHAGLSAASVLHIWETFIGHGGDPVEMMRAA